MKFSFKNLGYIDDGVIIPGNLTIIAGDNNLGKTYINYAIYSFLENLPNSDAISIENHKVNEILNTGFTIIDLKFYLDKINDIFIKYANNFSKHISTYFNVNEDFFPDTKIEFEYKEFNCEFNNEFSRTYHIGKKDYVRADKKRDSSVIDFYLNKETENKIPNKLLEDIFSRTISNIIFHKLVKRPFILTSERTGIALFYKELDSTKGRILDLLTKERAPHPIELLDTIRAKYAEPIKDNIDIIRDFENVLKQKSFLQKEKKEDYIKLSKKMIKILNGSYKVINKQLVFEPKKERNREKASIIPIYMASSATKSLLLLDLYLKSIAQENDVLMIDEPELNLHPTNQIYIARLLAYLVNLGIDVMITTHSDYMIKEFSNLIMLSNNFKDKETIMNEGNYDSFDVLQPDQVKTYYVENHKIEEAKVDKYGINLKLFDDTIMNINKISNDIYYSLED